jgi:hypothetical protein
VTFLQPSISEQKWNKEEVSADGEREREGRERGVRRHRGYEWEGFQRHVRTTGLEMILLRLNLIPIM